MVSKLLAWATYHMPTFQILYSMLLQNITTENIKNFQIVDKKLKLSIKKS